MSDDRKRKLQALANSARKSGPGNVSRRGPAPTDELPPRKSSSLSKSSAASGMKSDSRHSKGMLLACGIHRLKIHEVF